MYPDTFYYKGIRFDRQPQLELHSLIFSNDIYYAKWDDGVSDFRIFYDFIKNECDEKDYKYFVPTRRIRVAEIKGCGYGYLQNTVDYKIPRHFDADRFECTVLRLRKKYGITDFNLGHNVGFIDGQPKIYDLDLE